DAEAATRRLVQERAGQQAIILTVSDTDCRAELGDHCAVVDQRAGVDQLAEVGEHVDRHERPGDNRPVRHFAAERRGSAPDTPIAFPDAVDALLAYGR